MASGSAITSRSEKWATDWALGNLGSDRRKRKVKVQDTENAENPSGLQ